MVLLLMVYYMSPIGYIIYNKLCVLVNQCIPNNIIYNHNK